ncbi:hypothetical protein JGB96_23515, partial [Salmonella enterica subsp. enterica serovar Derby]|nr:hypothetical protein [Salmonella enterica subsp. enterica serovar Derby]
KLLWEDGVNTYDAFKKENFQLRAALMWTISDFPAYAMLSGWSTKGKLACPSCNFGTNSMYLKHSRKMCYMDHRVHLPMDHAYRYNSRDFNGKAYGIIFRFCSLYSNVTSLLLRRLINHLLVFFQLL